MRPSAAVLRGAGGAYRCLSPSVQDTHGEGNGWGSSWER